LYTTIPPKEEVKEKTRYLINESISINSNYSSNIEVDKDNIKKSVK
jgi:hypothetical protein